MFRKKLQHFKKKIDRLNKNRINTNISWGRHQGKNTLPLNDFEVTWTLSLKPISGAVQSILEPWKSTTMLFHGVSFWMMKHVLCWKMVALRKNRAIKHSRVDFQGIHVTYKSENILLSYTSWHSWSGPIAKSTGFYVKRQHGESTVKTTYCNMNIGDASRSSRYHTSTLKHHYFTQHSICISVMIGNLDSHSHVPSPLAPARELNSSHQQKSANGR